MPRLALSAAQVIDLDRSPLETDPTIDQFFVPKRKETGGDSIKAIFFSPVVYF